jgi:hypothetical protein
MELHLLKTIYQAWKRLPHDTSGRAGFALVEAKKASRDYYRCHVLVILQLRPHTAVINFGGPVQIPCDLNPRFEPQCDGPQFTRDVRQALPV